MSAFVSGFEFEQPYTHSTGEALGRFFTAVRDDGVIWGRRCARCDLVGVPALEHCESCGGDTGEWTPVGPEGTVEGFTVLGERAFARIRLDGAGVDLIHVADVRGLARGARVRPVWAPVRTGRITDIEMFTAMPHDAAEAHHDAPDAEPVAAIASHPRVPYALSAGALQSRFFDGVRDGEIHGNRCPSCEAVYVPPRLSCSRCWTRCEEWIRVADRGTLVTYVVVNVPFYGQQVSIPYVLGSILLDGATTPLLHLVGRSGDDGTLQPSSVTTGMRVRAVWRAERTGFLNEDVDHFEPEDA